jgi:hypothetical protein
MTDILTFKAVSTDSSLANHAIYLPDSSKTGSTKLPVLVWGNGGCGGDGASNAKFLGQVASYGYLVIASGKPGGSGSTTAQMMTQSIDFAVKVAGTGKYANVDATKIMAAGFSCGGVEAMAQSWDPRVKTIGIFSSGLQTNYTAASTFTKPILYCMGGSGDIAYNNVGLLSFPPFHSMLMKTGRARLQGSSVGHIGVEGQPSPRPRRRPLLQQRREVRQGWHQLDELALQGRRDRRGLLHQRLQVGRVDR